MGEGQRMRPHADIIRDAGGPAQVRRVLGLDAHEIHAVKSWSARGRIPSNRWAAFAAASLATLEELASADAMERTRG